MKKYEIEIIKAVKDILKVEEVTITTPPDFKLGDIAMPCFSFAKLLKKNPLLIAKELEEKLAGLEFVERIEGNGGYLNFFLKRELIVKDVLGEVKEKNKLYGSAMTGKDKTALIEHTSINPNASPHVGRARNAIIGDVLVRLLKFEGYTVDTHYFVNDIGKQIAMLLLGVEDVEKIAFKDLLQIYVDINKKVEENQELEEKVFELLYKLENGDEDVKDKFRSIVDICIKGQTEIFGELGIKYDTFKHESDYIWTGRAFQILEELKKTKKLEEDEEGRYVLNQEEYKLPMKAPYLVLTRKDKTSLYPLRDIAYTIDKVSTKADKNLVVLGEDQKLYFKQIEATLDLLGYKAPEPVHYSFVLLADGKMATRKGNVVLLEDFMKEALEKVKSNMMNRYETFEESIAKSIAYGAVKYAFLKVANDKNVTFDLEAALSFEGDSGPYLQYSYARINSIFKKYGKEVPENINAEKLTGDIEFELVKELACFEEIVSKALEETAPSLIATYIYSLVKKFSYFYHECPVLNAETEELKEARLVLIAAVKQVVENALQLLGIDTVASM